MAELEESRPLADLDDWESTHEVCGAAADATGKTTFRDYRATSVPASPSFTVKIIRTRRSTSSLRKSEYLPR